MPDIRRSKTIPTEDPDKHKRDVCHILKLPAELRYRIWTLLLVPPGNLIHIDKNGQSHWDLHPNILRTNHPIHNETADVLYKANTFIFYGRDPSTPFHSLPLWLGRIGASNIIRLRTLRFVRQHLYFDTYVAECGILVRPSIPEVLLQARMNRRATPPPSEPEFVRSFQLPEALKVQVDELKQRKANGDNVDYDSLVRLCHSLADVDPRMWLPSIMEVRQLVAERTETDG